MLAANLFITNSRPFAAFAFAAAGSFAIASTAGTSFARSSSLSKSKSQSPRPMSRHMRPLLVCSAQRQTMAGMPLPMHMMGECISLPNSPALRV